MIRALVIGALLIIGVLVFNAPATVLRQVFAQAPGVDLVKTNGTLWNGAGEVIVDGRSLGALTWRIRPAKLISLDLVYDVSLTDTDLGLGGELRGHPGGFAADLTGNITNAAINRFLAPYQITLAGDVAVEKLIFAASNKQRIEQLDGTLRWQGGNVSYPESTGMQFAVLPPFVAVLEQAEGQATANVFEQGSSTPLLQFSTLPGGAYRLGVTKRMTRLVGRPWRGSDPDHAVVLELEEQFL